MEKNVKEYNGAFHMERDMVWTQKWDGKRWEQINDFAKTWTIFETIGDRSWTILKGPGKPCYQTPRFEGLTRKAARKKLATLT